jgi:hypothetical protein
MKPTRNLFPRKLEDWLCLATIIVVVGAVPAIVLPFITFFVVVGLVATVRKILSYFVGGTTE